MEIYSYEFIVRLLETRRNYDTRCKKSSMLQLLNFVFRFYGPPEVTKNRTANEDANLFEWSHYHESKEIKG